MDKKKMKIISYALTLTLLFNGCTNNNRKVDLFITPDPFKVQKREDEEEKDLGLRLKK